MKRLSSSLHRLAQVLVFALLVRPFLGLVMGLAVRHEERLPQRGPAILIANHNSHLDTLALMARVPLGALWHTRPVAAADHFGRGLRGWLARGLLRVSLIERQGGLQALEPVLTALDRQQIVIFFPEGSRGEPEVLAPFRRGIAHLAACRPAVPVIPVHLRNMGKCMPRGAWLFVPFSCEMRVGRAAHLTEVPPAAIPDHLRSLVEGLAGPAALGWDVEEGHGLGELPG